MDSSGKDNKDTLFSALTLLHSGIEVGIANCEKSFYKLNSQLDNILDEAENKS